ncbi:MAG: M20/M25/M40 family metallo-hydrolase [Pseudonocardiaceae bacterium]
MTTLESTVSDLMDGLWSVLDELVEFASVNTGDQDPNHPVALCRKKIISKFNSAKPNIGAKDPAKELSLTYKGRPITPLVYANWQSYKSNAPTVLIYSHYDVQPAKKEDGWETDPFPSHLKPVNKPDGEDTRKYGRGAADDKSGIIMHLGVVQAFQSSGLPVNLKLVFEGEEETSFGTLEDYLNDPDHPSADLEPFQADVIVIADCGNVARGVPTLTTTLRGYASFDITVHTLDSPVHSGMYGGPAPDAFMALVRLLATLHDNNGDVAVAGLTRDDTYPFAPMDEEQFCINAGVRRGVPLIGTGSLAQRLCGRPSINVVGLDGVNSTTQAANVLCPQATARISVRLAPSQHPEEARQAIEKHLNGVRPWGIQPSVTFNSAGAGFRVDTDGKHVKTASEVLSKAYGDKPTALAGVGGSIPLVNALKKINQHADIVMWGCEEPRCRIHGTNESVSKDELTRMTIAETSLLEKIGNGA